MTGNGRSRADRLELSDLVCLTGDSTARDYAELPIPNERDVAVVELLRKARRTGGLGQLPELIRPQVEAAALRAFALRMATFAVRRADSDLFRLGLLAVAVASLRTVDRRADLAVLATLWRTAGRLRLEPATEFAAAAAEVPAASTLLSDWKGRPADRRDLAATGFQEAADADGFRYDGTGSAGSRELAGQVDHPSPRRGIPLLRRRQHRRPGDTESR
jgi:hypothetical protein